MDPITTGVVFVASKVVTTGLGIIGFAATGPVAGEFHLLGASLSLHRFQIHSYRNDRNRSSCMASVHWQCRCWVPLRSLPKCRHDWLVVEWLVNVRGSYRSTLISVFYPLCHWHVQRFWGVSIWLCCSKWDPHSFSRSYFGSDALN